LKQRCEFRRIDNLQTAPDLFRSAVQNRQICHCIKHNHATRNRQSGARRLIEQFALIADAAPSRNAAAQIDYKRTVHYLPTLCLR
jgi:hypothetical protein